MTIYMLAKLSKEEKQEKKWFLFGYLFILILCSVFAYAKYDHSMVPVESFTNQQMLINVDKRDLELTKENNDFIRNTQRNLRTFLLIYLTSIKKLAIFTLEESLASFVGPSYAILLIRTKR